MLERTDEEFDFDYESSLETWDGEWTDKVPEVKKALEENTELNLQDLPFVILKYSSSFLNKSDVLNFAHLNTVFRKTLVSKRMLTHEEQSFVNKDEKERKIVSDLEPIIRSGDLQALKRNLQLLCTTSSRKYHLNKVIINNPELDSFFELIAKLKNPEMVKIFLECGISPNENTLSLLLCNGVVTPEFLMQHGYSLLEFSYSLKNICDRLITYYFALENGAEDSNHIYLQLSNMGINVSKDDMILNTLQVFKKNFLRALQTASTSSINAQCKDGNHVVIYVVQNMRPATTRLDLEIAACILDKRADWLALNNLGNTFLHEWLIDNSMQIRPPRVVKNKMESFIKLLEMLQTKNSKYLRGIINQKNKAGMTPLMLAVKGGLDLVVKKLLDLGANPHMLVPGNKGDQKIIQFLWSQELPNKNANTIMSLLTKSLQKPAGAMNYSFYKAAYESYKAEHESSEAQENLARYRRH